MVTIEQLQQKEEKICVVGLGYVGLPLAILLAKQFDVVGFDVNSERIQELQSGVDRTKEVDDSEIVATSMSFTADPTRIADCKFIIIAVPTPVNDAKEPDMGIVKAATKTVAEHISDGSVVVYESTVYPGATEEDCIPILEEISGKTVGKEIAVGYSPERVNPGDKEHTIDKIMKVVSASDDQALETVAGLYGSITNVHRAPSIRVAEAAKVIENAQRDINIAFVNELAIMFQKMGISVYDVLDAAGTKWNFLPFRPGFVGGHCIGVDPYYLTYKSEQVGYTPEVILAGRNINDSMHQFVAQGILDQLLADPKDVVINILGVTFKESVPDIRNSKVVDMYRSLVDAGAQPTFVDPHADASEVRHEYDIVLGDPTSLKPADVLIVAVPHAAYAALTPEDLLAMTTGPGALVVDIKHIYNKEDIEAFGLRYWTL